MNKFYFSNEVIDREMSYDEIWVNEMSYYLAGVVFTYVII